MSEKLKQITLSFQAYEIELIKEALKNLAYSKLAKCPWEMQSYGGYNYTPSKEVKRLRFIENSIKRQLNP
jgi:hypothetical protein